MEVTSYMTMNCASSDTEKLAFWQQHSSWFPMLSKVAELYLSMSSALVPVCRSSVLNNWSHSEWQAIVAGNRQAQQNFIHS